MRALVARTMFIDGKPLTVTLGTAGIDAVSIHAVFG
jgi:hypothetical protein